MPYVQLGYKGAKTPVQHRKGLVVLLRSTPAAVKLQPNCCHHNLLTRGSTQSTAEGTIAKRGDTTTDAVNKNI